MCREQLWEKKNLYFLSPRLSCHIGECLTCKKIFGFELKISFLSEKSLFQMGWFFILALMLLSYSIYLGKTQDSSCVDIEETEIKAWSGFQVISWRRKVVAEAWKF